MMNEREVQSIDFNDRDPFSSTDGHDSCENPSTLTRHLSESLQELRQLERDLRGELEEQRF